MPNSKSTTVAYWIFTVLFCLQMGFTAYAQLNFPDVASEFTRLGFPNYFRLELGSLKVAGVLVLLVPIVPVRLKEWAYAGFTIVLGSALVAHLACGDDAAKWGWSAGTLVLGTISYWFYRKRGATLA
jgi:hypothetical protein